MVRGGPGSRLRAKRSSTDHSVIFSYQTIKRERVRLRFTAVAMAGEMLCGVAVAVDGVEDVGSDGDGGGSEWEGEATALERTFVEADTSGSPTA